MVLENSKYEILTVEGFKDFDGYHVSMKDTYRYHFGDIQLECTDDHLIYSVDRDDWVEAGDLVHTERVQLLEGTAALTFVEHIGEQEVVDFVNVQDVHSFIANGINVHNCLFLDEMAFVPHNIQEALWTSLSPTLATGGSLIIASTPNGDTDIFSQIWRGANTFLDENDTIGTNGFKPLKVLWDSVPGRNEKFKQQEIAKIGELKFRQEYDCEFISSDPLLIDSILLNRLSDESAHNRPVGRINDVRLYELPKSGNTYIIGVDPATGSGSDYTTIVGFKFPEMVQVLEYRSNTMSSSSSYKTLRSLIKYYERAQAEVYFSVENNGVGEGIITLIEHDEGGIERATFVSEEGKNRLGFVTTSTTKLKTCITLKEMIEHGRMHVKSPMMLHELKHFIRTRGSYDHQKGATSDLISATLIVLRILDDMSTYDETAYAKLYNFETHDDSTFDFEENTDYNPSDFLVF